MRQRTRELGVMMALGARPGVLVRLIVTESLLLAVVGAVFGGLMGGALTYLLCAHGLDLGYGEFDMGGIVFPETIKGLFRADRAAMVLVSLMVVTVLASLWPAWRAARLQPVQAMRAD